MRFVRRLRTLELPLRDITQIVALRTAGQAPCAVVRDALARELEAIEDRIDQLRKLGEELSRLQHEAGQVQGQVLSSALDQAVEDGLLVRNPAKQVKGPKVRPRRQLFLQADEVERLATAAEDRQRGAGTLVQFLGYSGLRWGEAVALRASSVDLAGGRVEVAEAATEINGRLVFGLPKTHEKRTVYLAPRFVVDRLGELIGDRDGDALVFTTPGGTPLRSSNFRRGVWLPAVEAAGLPNGLMVHDLRDTAASLMISSGASIKAVQHALGHANASMTLDRYAGLFVDDLKALADRMERRFGDGAEAAQGGHSGADIVPFPRSEG